MCTRMKMGLVWLEPRTMRPDCLSIDLACPSTPPYQCRDRNSECEHVAACHSSALNTADLNEKQPPRIVLVETISGIIELQR